MGKAHIAVGNGALLVIDDICNALGINTHFEKRGMNFCTWIFNDVAPPRFMVNKKHLHFFEQMRKGIMTDVVQQTRREKYAHIVDINIWRGLGFEQLLEEMARNVKHT